MKKCLLALLVAATSLPALAVGSTHVGFVNAATDPVTLQAFRTETDLHRGCATIQAQESPNWYFWPLTDEQGTPLRLPPLKVAREGLVVFRMAFRDQPTQEVPVSDHCIYQVRDPALDRQFYLIHTAAALVEDKSGTWVVRKEATVDHHLPDALKGGPAQPDPAGPILVFRRQFVIFLGWRDQPPAQRVAWLEPLLSRAAPALESSPEEREVKVDRTPKPALEPLPASAWPAPAPAADPGER